MDGDDFHYEYRQPRSPVPAAIMTSLVTSLAVFFGLRILDQRGLLPGSIDRRGASEPAAKAAPVAAESARAPTPAPEPAPAAAPATVPVPNLVGLKAEDALRQLTAAGLTTGPRKSVVSETVVAGAVVALEPPVGSPLPPGGAVALVVSSGIAAKPVPKLTGMRLRYARRLLEEQGFVLGKLNHISDGERTSGVILEQKPAPGSNAAPGTAIDLFVNEE